MGELSFYCHSVISGVARHALFLFVIYLFFEIININGFNPLIQLLWLKSWNFYKWDQSSSSSPVLCIDDFGAKGNGINDDTQALQNVWEVACSLSSEPEIILPAGKTYLVRPIDFAGHCHSKLTLRISGTIVAPWNPDVWEGLNTHRWLYFSRVKNFIIEGGGTIDGMGWEWWARSCKRNKTNPCRHAPTAITFHRCKNLKVRNLNVVDSQQMHMAFTVSASIAVTNLRIIAPAHSPNTDGIHISASRRVEIKNSNISTGDDCISIVSNSSRIHISNIVCGPGHGISIGSLGKSNYSDEVHDVKVNGAKISNTENGVRIKTWQGGSGFVKMISFQNLWMENVSNPIIVDQYYCDSRRPCDNQTSAIRVDEVSFVGIKGTSATETAIVFACSDSSPCRRLYLEDVELVSYSGELTKSFCWEAYGSSSGLVYPPPCLSCGNSIIQHKSLPSSIGFI